MALKIAPQLSVTQFALLISTWGKDWARYHLFKYRGDHNAVYSDPHVSFEFICGSVHRMAGCAIYPSWNREHYILCL